MSQNDFADRHSWADLLKEAITRPGIIHEGYSRFWNYSFGNQLLALMQCRERGIEPGPLASFNRWKELGRHVKKGEKAITLCMPIKIKCREWDQKRQDAGLIEGDEVQSAGFRTAFVFKRNWFVLSQTDGEPYKPEPMPDWDKERALASLDIREEPFSLTDGNCQGYATKTRAVSVSPIASLPHKTMFHEIAHIMLGHLGTEEASQMSDGDHTPRSIKEAEAEAVALLCCESLGLPGCDYARGYIQSWLDGQELPDNSARKILQTADRILKAGMLSGEPKDAVERPSPA